MGLFRRINQWFSKSQKSSDDPKTVLLNELTDKARRNQYAEQFDDALAFLAQAMEIAKEEHKSQSQVDITLSRADILILQRDFENARLVLNELHDDVEAREMKASQAYSLCSLGVLEQTQGNLAKAQEYFEKAREIAESIKTDGAYGRATAHLGEINLAQDNANYAVYLLEDAIPKLDRSGDRELLAHFLAQLGLAHIQNGQSEQGQNNLQRALELATNIKHRGQLRYINITLGEQALQNADFRLAQSYLDNAYSLHLNQQKETSGFTKLLCNLSKVYLHIEQLESAKRFAKAALSVAKKLNDPVLIAMSKAVLGLAMYESEDSEALSYLQDAAEAYKDVVADSFAINILRNLAGVQIASGNTEKGIQTYHKAINKAEHLPLEIAQVYSDLAIYHAEKRDLREAIKYWQNALKNFQETKQTDFVALVTCDIALMYDQLGDGRMAQREYGKALEMLSQIDNTVTRGIILANVASAYSEYGDVDSAQDFFNEAIEIAQRNLNSSAEALRRGNYGRLLAFSNHPIQALAQLTQAQTTSKELGLELQSAIMLGNLGLANAMMDDHKSAIIHYKSALVELDNLDASKWIAIVHANLADSFLQKNNLDDASEHYKLAFSGAKDLTLVDVLIQTLIGQAHIALRQDKLTLAQKKLTEAHPLVQRLNYRRLIALHLQAKSQLYAQQNKPDEALSAWEEAKKIRNIMQMPTIIPDWL